MIKQIRAKKRKGVKKMSEIRVKDNESIDSALRRFKRSCAKSGILAEVRKREHYEKPSVKRKKKAEAAADHRLRSCRFGRINAVQTLSE